jgi:hypothetical protein
MTLKVTRNTSNIIRGPPLHESGPPEGCGENRLIHGLNKLLYQSHPE